MALLKHIFLEHGKLMEKPTAVPNFDFFSRTKQTTMYNYNNDNVSSLHTYKWKTLKLFVKRCAIFLEQYLVVNNLLYDQ